MSEIGFRRGIPRTALALDEERRDGSPRPRKSHRRVLVYGDLPKATERFLVGRGALLLRAETAVEAVSMLAEEAFDVVVLDARAPGGGLQLVKVIKLGQRTLEIPDAIIERAMKLARLTPFVVLPLDGSTEFGVIVQPPDLAFLDDGDVGQAIMYFDASKLQRRVN